MADVQRYDPVAVTLHWAIALMIIVMVPLGFFMGNLPFAMKIDAYIVHKSIGLVVLALSIFRLIWRFLNPPPPLPEHMKPWERMAAHVSHWMLYFLIIAMPLTGWLMVSATKKYPTIFFWLGEVPFIPMPADDNPSGTAYMFESMHGLLAFGAIALVALHAGAALGHHFIDKDTVLMRMLPRWLIRRNHA